MFCSYYRALVTSMGLQKNLCYKLLDMQLNNYAKLPAETFILFNWLN